MGSYGQSILQEYVRSFFGCDVLVEHRPDWLCGLEIDLFIPEWRIGFEFQGDQHYVSVFGQEALLRQRRNDINKRQLCHESGYVLVKVDAADLEYTRLYRKIKTAYRQVGLNELWYKFKSIGKNKKILRRLNKKAIEYRKTLKERFGSPTAYSQKHGARKIAKRVWRIKNIPGYEEELAKSKAINANATDERQSTAQRVESEFQRLLENPYAGEDGVLLTRQILESLRTPARGYSKATLLAFGLGYPLPNKWKKRMEGHRISTQQLRKATDGAGRFASDAICNSQ